MRLEDGKTILFLLLLTLCAFQLISAQDARADHQINEMDTSAGSVQASQNLWCRGTNNTLYHVYTGSLTDVIISWSIDNGSTWYEHIIFDDTWKSQTIAAIQGIVISSNGTIFVGFYLNGGVDATHATYLARHNTTDDLDGRWDSITLATSGTYGFTTCDMIIDRNDLVWVWGYWNSDISYVYYNMSTDSTSGNPTRWVAGTNLRASVVYDMNGDMWISYIYWDSVNYIFTTRDFAKTIQFSYTLGSTAVWNYATATAVTNGTGTDARVCAWLIGWWGGGTRSYGFYLYESTDNTSYTRRTVVNTNTEKYSTICSIGIQENNTVYLHSYLETDGDDDVIQWHAEWDALEATFISSERTIYTVPDNDDYLYLNSGATAWYPRLYGYAAAIPTEGYFTAWTWQNELGATDDFNRSVNWSATFYLFPDNSPPEISNETPTDGSTGIELQPWCNVTVEDPDGDTFDVTWEENSTGSWVVRQQNITCTNGTFWWQFTQATSYSMRYYWRVSADDGLDNTTTIFHFDLLLNINPVGVLIFPLNGSTGITLTPTCRITVSDGNGDDMDISWLENTTGSWVERHEDAGVSDGEQSFSFTQFSSYGITYYWRINLTDGTANVTYIYHFTTGADNPPSISSPVPSNGSSGVSLSPTCYITVGDQDNMNISWYEWDETVWIHQQTNTSVPSGTYGWLFSGASSNSTEYWWLVNVTDGTTNVSKMFYFTTLGPTDGEEVTEDVMEWTSSMIMMFLIIVVIIAGTATIIAVFGRVYD